MGDGGGKDNGQPNGNFQPSDQDAERAVLGGALLSPVEQADVVAGRLTEASFTKDSHRLVFRAICRLRSGGKPADVVLVKEDLLSHRELAANGADPGKPTATDLLGLQEACPVAAAVPEYCGVLLRKARLRRLIALTTGASRTFQSEPTDEEVNSAAASVLEELRETAMPAAEVQTATEALRTLPHLPPVWGEGEEVLWPSGEPLLIVARPGLGKTRFALNLVLARLGVGPPDMLGYPVLGENRPVLYIGADRPRQALRLLGRMLAARGSGPEDPVLDYLIWRGRRPDWDIAREPGRLALWASRLGVGTVVIDSLGNVAREITKGETGEGIHMALSDVVSAGIEVLVLHHTRKATADNRHPDELDDTYGSQYIGAAAGSILLLKGRAGDPIIQILHRKQPMEDVGPITARYDPEQAAFTRVEDHDPLTLLRLAHQGLTARDIARTVYGSDEPNDVDKARRKLRRLGENGLAHRSTTAPHGEARWFATVPTPQGRLQ